MKVQVNPGDGIDGSENLSAFVERTLEEALSHLAAHVTRIEVHLQHEGGVDGGQSSLSCSLEARMENRPPDVVSHVAENLDGAVTGATHKLKRVLSKQIDKLRDYGA